jgi:hypothetical protein
MQPGTAMLEALQGGSFAAAMRDSIWLYPAVETVHIIGFAILVGAVIMFDLRLLGVSKRVPVRMLAQHLLPWSVAALLLIVPAGFLMFSADATTLISNRAFVVKMVLLVLAATNAAAFHLGSFRSVQLWDLGVKAPRSARLHAAASLIIWLGVVTCGRMIAYV